MTVVASGTAAATQVNRVGLMSVTVSAADATTANYDIVVVLKASVVVDYYAMITACATAAIVGGAADCTTVLIGVAR